MTVQYGSLPRTDSETRIERALRASIDWLLREQTPDGYWVGAVETNSCMEAEWLLACHILNFRLPIADGVIKTLFDRQRPDGSWDVYPGAPAGDVNSTVEVYAALRATGHDATRPELRRAREWILAHGGLQNVRVFTRYWLAMLGVWPWQHTPNVPPEIIRFPLWFPFNIYNFAQWARATMVPIAVLCARRPVWPLPGGSRLEELFPDGYEKFNFAIPPKKASRFSVDGLFQAIDRALHAVQSLGLVPFRETTIKLCLEWMIKHQDADGSWGGIQPPWIYGLIALRNEGYPTDHPVMAHGLGALVAGHWNYRRNGGISIQATNSPVWDTLLSLLALSESGRKPDTTPAVEKATRWILDRQGLVRGDWSVQAKDLAPGGWSFELFNDSYPDVDDTAVALLLLAQIRDRCGALRADVDRAIDRAVNWLFGMQSANGGWGAFDRDNDKRIISRIPFANFGEALDPPSADVTAHVLEALGSLGYTTDHPAMRRALDFVLSEQEPDGSWFGRWGVNYIYGLGAVLPALRALEQDMTADRIRRAAQWLVVRQNADGGWGESCASYMLDSARGRGESTPSQTAWALLALIAAGGADVEPTIERGLDYLVRTQLADGTWHETAYTGTGFPGYGVGARLPLDDPDLFEKLQQGPELSRGFVIGYNLYRHYFPMLALARAGGRRVT